jgi:[protein-PII] uridylyltransferase
MEINILESRIVISKDNMSLFSFSILDNNLETFDNTYSIDKVCNNILSSIEEKTQTSKLQVKKQYHTHRHFKLFQSFNFSKWNDLTVLHISSTDAPGILSLITQVLLNNKIRVHNAKIGVIGEKIDNVFFISTLDNKILNDNKINNLRDKLNVQFTNHYQAITHD